MDPRLWFFWIYSSFWCYYLFYNDFPSIWKFWSCCCLSFCLLSNKLKTGCPFHRINYDYSRGDWDGLCDHLRDVLWEDISKLGATAASEFCEWVQVGNYFYIPHRKYQVKHHSSPWFSVAFAAAIVHRNSFFSFYKN